MGIQDLKSKQLTQMGFPKGSVSGQVLELARKHYRRADPAELLEVLTKLSARPQDFLTDPVWGLVAAKLEPAPEPEPAPRPEKQRLRDQPQPYQVFGGAHVPPQAREQLELAMRLPVALQGALMPDAHKGYGLPVGGVLATQGAVIPYAVGMDIGCRMCLSILEAPGHRLDKRRERLEKVLFEQTRFGNAQFRDPAEHPVLDRPEFQDTPLLRGLRDTAWRQLGSSGGGNHFVEFGIVDIPADLPEMGLEAGQYMGLLSHSGSRSLGAGIATHYTRVARATTRLPREVKHLSWLDLDTEDGQAYWLAMNLAGDYASACHHDIHRRILKEIGATTLACVENHHNFAWIETLPDGTEAVVHRKGATPAAKGQLGMIPGSMTQPGFVVRGLGMQGSLASASHGAGRRLSRKEALNSITRSSMQKALAAHGVTLIGADIDEAPDAYKDIHAVMAAQTQLVEAIASFHPKIVRME